MLKSKKTLVAGVLIAFLALPFLGPFFYTKPPAKIPLKPYPLLLVDKIILEQESRHQVKQGTEKRIFWHNPKSQERTQYAFVYLHGFSASRQEASPLFENLAGHFSANIFLTRLFAHGLKHNFDFKKLEAEDLYQDALTSLRVGTSIGRKTIIGCTSTGCALALYLAHQYPENIRALIMLSPNYRPRPAASVLAAGPLGPILLQLTLGNEYKFQAKNPEQEYYWTTQYSSRAIHAMMDVVQYARYLDLSQIKIPVLTLYSPKDQVVSIDLIRKKTAEFKNPKNQLVSFNSSHHVLAGDILGSEHTQDLLKIIKSWLELVLNI